MTTVPRIKPWPHPWPPGEHCWHHNAHEPEPEGGAYMVCGECWHLFATADDLLAAANAMVDQSNAYLARDPSFDPAMATPHETDAAKVTVCPYCAVGCGTIAYVHGSGGLNTKRTIIHVEGDPDSPINGGTLCPKGAAQMQLAISPRLEHGPKLRRAGA